MVKETLASISSSEDSDHPIKIIYIMGAGRSGSTIVDTVLGNHPQVESVGELINVAKSAWQNAEYCACGKKGNECPYWTEVKKEFEQKIGKQNIRKFIELQSQFESPNFKGFYRLLRERKKITPSFQVYANYTLALFNAIQKVSGKAVIVDSSKLSKRALALAIVPGIDIHIIHLIRDGRGVGWSLKKAYSKNTEVGIQNDIPSRPIWRTTIFWIISNMLSTWTIKQIDTNKSIRLRYEDFVTEPEIAIKKIGDLIGLNFESITKAIQNSKEFVVGHTIAGNRLRMSGKIRLTLDEEWKHKLPRKDKLLFWILAGWLMNIYQYKRII